MFLRTMTGCMFTGVVVWSVIVYTVFQYTREINSVVDVIVSLIKY